MLEICFVRLMVKYPAELPHEHKELALYQDINIMYHCGFEVKVPISNLVMLFFIIFLNVQLFITFRNCPNSYSS